LNKDLSNFNEEGICLSTIHGSKGLEWAYVYIIDVNSNDFPSIKQQFFKDEIECLEEERRLFYVACSRAKKFLTITYHTSNNISISPFIRELDSELYYGNQVNIDTVDNIDYYKLITLDVKEKQIHNEFPIISYKKKKSHNTYFNNLIFKMIHNNYKIKNFDSVYKNNNKKLYYEYIDEQNHWSNLLNVIFEKDTDILVSNQTFDFYKNVEIGLKKILDQHKTKSIQIVNNDILIDDIVFIIDDYCSIKTMNRIFNTHTTINKIYVYNLLEGLVYIIS
jgi:ATP-dependent exoDNAse (exonuclease V) beta subunit